MIQPPTLFDADRVTGGCAKASDECICSLGHCRYFESLTTAISLPRAGNLDSADRRDSSPGSCSRCRRHRYRTSPAPRMPAMDPSPAPNVHHIENADSRRRRSLGIHRCGRRGADQSRRGSCLRERDSRDIRLAVPNCDAPPASFPRGAGPNPVAAHG